MKKLKVLLSVLLSAMLVLSLVVPSMADTTGGTIVINGTKDQEAGETYTAYKIFNLDYVGNKGVYTATDKMITLLTEASKYGITFSDDGDRNGANERYVTFSNTSQENLKKFAAYLNTLNLTGVPSKSATSKMSSGKPKTTIDVKSLGAGYFFVNTTVGTICLLDNVVSSNAAITDKNEDITVTKVIVEGNEEKEENTAETGDVIQFKTTITIPAGNEKVVLHDTMEDGFTFNNDIKVFELSGSKLNELTLGTAYTVKTDEITENCKFNGVEAKCDFEISFDDTKWLKAQEKTVVVTYSATLNENAEVMASSESLLTNDNNTKVTYGAKQETAVDYTKTKTAQFVLYKVDKDTQDPLAEAKFQLKQGDNVVKLYKESNTVYRVIADTATSNCDDTITSLAADAHKITIKGLNTELNYHLVETVAPEGYNKINTTIPFDMYLENKIENSTGALLPETGGTGTKVLFTVGGIMMVVAFVLITSKRRMAAEK